MRRKRERGRERRIQNERGERGQGASKRGRDRETERGKERYIPFTGPSNKGFLDHFIQHRCVYF